MELPINTRLMGHPVNWLTVWVMLWLGGALLDVILQYHVSMASNSGTDGN